MTEVQTKWFLNTFFLPTRFPGTESIARKLIEFKQFIKIVWW